MSELASRACGATAADAFVERIVIAVTAGKRVAYWGYDEQIFAKLAALPAFTESPLFVVSDRASDHGGAVPEGPSVASPEALTPYQPDLIAVLDPSPHRIFERLLLLGFGPAQILLPEGAWQQRLVVSDARFEKALAAIPRTIAGGLSGPEVTIHAFDALRYIAEQDIPGDVVNFGVFQGWSMYFCATSLRLLGDRQSRSLIGFDTFTGFVPTGDKYDRFVAHQCGLGKTGWNFYKNTSRTQVAANMADFARVELIEGDICNTVDHLRGRKLAFALFDMDDYVPTKVALEPSYEALVPDGVFVLDHFSYHTLADGSAIGQRLAMQEFLKSHSMFNLTGTNIFLR